MGLPGSLLETEITGLTADSRVVGPGNYVLRETFAAGDAGPGLRRAAP